MASEIPHDRSEQLKLVQEGLLPGENVIAVYDAKGQGTGFIGLTDRRIVLQDNSLVGGKITLLSVPYKRIYSVGYVTDKSVLGQFNTPSTLAIQVGSHTHEVEFRGDEKAQHAHDVILHYLLLS